MLGVDGLAKSIDAGGLLSQAQMVLAQDMNEFQVLHHSLPHKGAAPLRADSSPEANPW